MLILQKDWGQVERLHAAVRRRAPQVAASIQSDRETGARWVRVTYRHAGPMLAEWDGQRYRWRAPDGPWEELYPDPEVTADAMAETLGARPRSPGAPDGRP